MGEGTYRHVRGMIFKIKHCIRKDKCRLTLGHSTKRNSDYNFEFGISGKSDSYYTKCPYTRRSISRYRKFLCN